MAYATNSLGNYSGTIVVSPIRPINPSSSIASFFSNEAKGFHHTYETVAERNTIPLNRRDWGMLVTIWNDVVPTNNKTYILSYGWLSTDLSDNSNWIEFVTTGANFVPVGGEWINSVQSISATPSVFIDGWRYLVDNGATGSFFGQDGKIAQWVSASSTFSFVEPTEGTTLRVDSQPNVLYKYDGNYSSGSWVKEFFNEIRYLNAISTNGLTYSATSVQTPITSLSQSIYYVTFNMTSSGTVSLDIDGLGYVNLKKLENNTTNFLTTDEILPNFQYQLVYNSGFLQTVLPNSSVTNIGLPEDGVYSDGFFSNFTSSTTIGTSIDRFNQLLQSISPAQAPNLSSWSAEGSFVNGGISFDSNTSGGFFGATGSPYGSVLKGGIFSSTASPYRLGIRSHSTQPITGDDYYTDIRGTLNIGVPKSYSYGSYSIGSADIGTLSFFLNGVTMSSLDLTLNTSFDTTANDTVTGLSLSTPSYILDAYEREFPYFKYRVGSYVIKRDDSNIRYGYNYFSIRHDFGTYSLILNDYEFISDFSVLPVIDNSTSVSFPNLSLVTKKFISGIQFYTHGFSAPPISYQTTLINLLSTTYNSSSSALSFVDNSAIISTTNSVTGGLTYPVGVSIFNASPNQPIVFNAGYIPSSPYPLTKSFSFNENVRRINQTIGFSMIVKKTVQGTFSTGTTSTTQTTVTNWFIDTVSNGSTTILEDFSGEIYRKTNGSTKYGTFLTLNLVNRNTWSPSISLTTGGPGYNNALQVINGMLIYPSFNFSSAGTGVYRNGPNPNFGVPSRDYSSAASSLSGFGTSSIPSTTNNRTYTRLFTTGAKSIWNLKIDYLGATFSVVPSNTTITGSQIWLEAKFFNSSTASGWMDIARPFISNQSGDGSGAWIIGFNLSSGSYSTNITPGNILMTDVLLRITAGPSFSSQINRIFCG
jgi:hypothetical protein